MAFALAAAIVLGACAAPPRHGVDAVAPSGDHRQLAEFYAREAARQEADALKHEELARSYVGLSLGVNDGLWARHCARLAAKLHGAARDSLKSSQFHERAATAAAE